MKTRISAIVGLLCVLGAPLSASAGAELQTMPSGTYEPYLSFMGGVAIPFSEDATFQGELPPTGPSGVAVPRVINDVDYQMKQSWGGSAGIWFPTRNKLWGFDLGAEITGYVWYPDVACCLDYYNRDPATGAGTTTEINGIYIGSNLMLRYPLAISEAYPNGRWFPYVGIGVGAHQFAMKPGGQKGVGFQNAITELRDTAVAFQGVGGIKAHLFKYVAVFAEAKYLHASHSGLTTDRFGLSGPAFDPNTGLQGVQVANTYESTINTILVHVGMSMHFDIKP